MRRCGERGVTLLELLVAMVLLAMVSAMLYSVLRVGIGFSATGTRHLERLAREQNLLNLMRRQVASVWFDPRRGAAGISSAPGVLRLVTRQPLLHRDAGVVLAVYRVDPEGPALYYQEKKDFYNVAYGREYIPDFQEMERLYAPGGQRLELEYRPEQGGVVLTVGEASYTFFPKALLPASSPTFSNVEQ
ncbi:MAG: PulJ/GspJ family protein [Thermodesulfobacteriota bacterium]